MCGIAGIINFNKTESLLGESILRMTQAQKHRGPDDDGFLFFNNNGSFICYGDVKKEKVNNYINKPSYYPVNHISETKELKSFLAFGFRRLAIQDITISGHQPMSYLDRYWIVFNGEIYNFIELREELVKEGYTFVSKSDTEVIMAAYDFWGTECLNKFNGMWAFVIYDIKEDKIFLSRDRFGIKPLYYYLDDKYFMFSSEIKGILNNSYYVVKPNYEFLKDFIKTYPKDYIEETAFKDIYKFPKANYVEIKINELNKFTSLKKEYYKLTYNSTNSTFKSDEINYFKDEYINLLTNAVKLRLRSDVPVGTSLSGGLDSSSIAYLINKIYKENSKEHFQKTFSLVFNTNKELKNYDEKRHIEKLIDFLQLNAHYIEPTLEDVQNEYLNTIYAMENPQDDMLLSCMFTYKLYNLNNIKVAIDGQGADELQGGYLRYLMHYFSNLPLKELKSKYIVFKDIPGAKKEMMLGIFFNISKKIGLKNTILKILPLKSKFKDPFVTPEERMYDDFISNLENLLHFGDRSAMFYSVESRFPFLDYRIVEFWFKLPLRQKLNAGWTKYLARLAFNGKLPSEITWRRDKMGWEIPQKYWFDKVLKENALKIFSNHEIINQLKLEKQIKKHLKKCNKNNKSFKWILKLYNLCLWYDIFISKKIQVN